MFTLRSRRALAALAAFTLLVTACGDDDTTASSSESSSASESESASASASESESASASESESASASDSASASETAEESDESTDESAEGETAGGAAAAETVVVADVLGETEVPVTAEGVYSLDEFATLALLTLGVDPIQAESFFQDLVLAPVIEAEGIPLVAAGSVEAIAATQPRLILGIGHPIHMEARDEHLGVAPTATPDFTTSWADQLAVFGQATGTSDRADVVIGTVQARIDELAARVEAEGLAGSEISIVQQFGPEYYAYGPTTLVGDIAAQLGFARSEVQSGAGDFGFIQISEELLGAETAAPVVIDIDSGEGDASSIFDSPVVDTTSATATGMVSYAWTGNHALAAWVILDDMESILFGDGSITMIPDIVGSWESLVAAVDAA